MSFPTFLFYVFAAILVFAALRVVTTRNPVHAALWLVLAFFTAAAHWLMLRAEFLAIALVLVYVGAVMVLFLFVVMMLDVNFDSLRAQFRNYLPVARHRRRAGAGRDGAGAARQLSEARHRGCAGAGGGRQHPRAGPAALHRLRLRVRDRRRRAAGRDHRGDRADAPPAPRDAATRTRASR